VLWTPDFLPSSLGIEWQATQLPKRCSSKTRQPLATSAAKADDVAVKKQSNKPNDLFITIYSMLTLFGKIHTCINLARYL
jgi:hypothetical protein